MLRVQAPLNRQGPGYRLGNDSAGCQLLGGGVLSVTLRPALIASLYKVPFPRDRHLGGFLVADWLDLVVVLVTPVLGLCRSCQGQLTFGETAVWWVIIFVVRLRPSTVETPAGSWGSRPTRQSQSSCL
jgi:hypothetical protein